MSTAPATGTSIELIHMVAVDGVIARDSFTGNGSTTAYVLSMSISNENATQVYLDGVYQSKNNYSTSGSTLTFSTAPPNGTAIEVVHIKAVNASSLNQNNFTGNGSTTAFTLSQSIDDETKTFVFIQGVYQEKSTYSISGTTLTFTTAPQSGYTVEVMAFSTISVGNQGVTSINGLTGAVTLETGTDWQSTIQTSNFTAVAGKGYFVNTTSGTVTVSLPAGNVGDEIHFVDYASTFDTNEIIFNANGSEKIQGRSTPAKNSTENAIIRLIYQDATKGWTSDNLTDDPPLVTVQYLVVAGGGGTRGDGPGGGGAGGLRTSWTGGSGGGGASETAIVANLNTNYTVTVGAGGAAATSGNDSVFSTITSVAGGRGGGSPGGSGNVNYNGAAGGSGGGGAGGLYSASGGAGTANQGYAGGPSGPCCGTNYGGGGGGGAAGTGAGPANSGAPAGNGGPGKAVAITGSSVTYAGGGGGSGSSSQGTGGAGGGANGTTGANAGGTNLGGGGAGTNATGGSGVIILRYPNTNTINIGSGLTGSTATDGSDKVTTFTVGSGTITFS